MIEIFQITWLRKEYFLLLLPLFFIIHGYTIHYPLVEFTIVFKLFLIYLSATALLSLTFLLIFRNWRKASVYSFLLMFLYFFFGSIHDSMKKLFVDSFISKYSFLLPIVLVFTIFLYFLIRKTKRSFNRLTVYLNITILFLLLVDLSIFFLQGYSEPKKSSILKKIDNSSIKPDIYLIIADEYAGTRELNDLFKFDNSSFENNLRERGFHIIKDPKSNYNYTPYSMASMLSMNYLPGITKKSNDFNNRGICYRSINNNNLINILSNLGYEFINYSLFDFAGLPTQIDNQFYSTREKLITSQTLFGRIYKDLWFHMILNFEFEWAINQYHNKLLEGIHYLYNNTLATITNPSTKPRFVYTHLAMPHYPYFFDKFGKKIPFKTALDGGNKKLYLEYLQYCNTQFLTLIDHILSKNRTPPIIILMSDHGFTKYDSHIDPTYNFSNINTIYLPDKNYTLFYDGMSNVNQFRALLNTQFNQNLPMLKDSSIYLLEY